MQPMPERRRDAWGVLILIRLDGEWAEVRGVKDSATFRLPRTTWEALRRA